MYFPTIFLEAYDQISPRLAVPLCRSRGRTSTQISQVLGRFPATATYDARFIPRVLSIGNFAFAIKIPVRRTQRFENVRILILQCVENVMGRDDIALASFEGFCYAE